jgi:hypothetical protein
MSWFPHRERDAIATALYKPVTIVSTLIENSGEVVLKASHRAPCDTAPVEGGVRQFFTIERLSTVP